MRLFERIKKNSLVKDSALSLFFRITGIVSSYLLFIFLSRTGGAKLVGEFSLGFNYITLMGQIATVGLPVALLRFGAPFAEQNHWRAFIDLQKKVVSLQAFSGVIFALFSFFIGNSILHVLYKQELPFEYVIILSIGVPFFCMNLVNADLIRCIGNIKLSEFFRNIMVPFGTVTVLAALWLAKLRVNEIYVYIMTIISAGVLGTITVIIVVYNERQKCHEPKDAPLKAVCVSELFKTSLPMALTSFSMLIIGKINVLILGYYYPLEVVGQFQIALKLAMTTSLLLQAVNIIIGPRIAAQYWKGKKEDVQKTLQTGVKITFLGSLPFLTIFFLFPKYILLIFGNEFVTAVPILVILTIGQTINAWSGSVGYYLNMTGKQHILSRIVITSMVLNIILNFIIIPVYGGIGAAIVTVVAMITINLSATIYTLIRCRVLTFFMFNISCIEVKNEQEPYNNSRNA